MKKNLENGVTSKINNAPALGDRGRYKKKITYLGIYLVILLLGLFGSCSIAYGKNSNSYYLHEVLKYFNAYNLYESFNQNNISKTDFENYINNYNGIFIRKQGTTWLQVYSINYINTNNETVMNATNYEINLNTGQISRGTINNANYIKVTNVTSSYNYTFAIAPYISDTRIY